MDYRGFDIYGEDARYYAGIYKSDGKYFVHRDGSLHHGGLGCDSECWHSFFTTEDEVRQAIDRHLDGQRGATAVTVEAHGRKFRITIEAID